MVTVNENIRFYKPNDPYFYEVDNLPLIDLVKNDKLLADAINDILQGDTVFATEDFVQNAIDPLKTRVDLKGTGFTNIVDWVLDQPFGASTLADLNDVDLQVPPLDGQVLRYNSEFAEWRAQGGFSNEVVYFDRPQVALGFRYKGQTFAGVPAKDNPSTTPFYVGGIRMLSMMESTPDANTEADGSQSDIDAYDTDPTGLTRFSLPRTFGALNIPANTKSIICNMHAADAPHSGGRSNDRQTIITMQNGHEMNVLHGTGGTTFGHNQIISVYAQFNDTRPMQTYTTRTNVEIPLGPKQIADQTIYFELLTTAKNVKDPLGYAGGDFDGLFPFVYVEIIGYRT
jgi:hypothetical protein